MLPAVEVNYLAILACAVASMIIGFVWYSLPVFGRTWMNLIGKSEADLKKGEAPVGYLVTFVLALLLAFVLKHFLVYTGATSVGEGLQTGLWVSLGFVVATMIPNHIFEGSHPKLIAINVGYQIVNVLVASIILTLWA
jgi:hypothetical protein